jgi:hypothetical protein
MSQEVEYKVTPDYQTIQSLQFSDTEAVKALAPRMAKAILAVDRVPLNGYNAFHKYHYATAADVKAVARQALADNDIVLVPSIRSVQQNGKATSIDFDMTLIFPEGYMVMPWQAEAHDTQDKGVNKCVTAALKYFLIALLQIPTGDEPDADGSSGDDKGTKDVRLHQPPNPEQQGPEPFQSPEAAIRWGYDQGVFQHMNHARNAYEKCKEAGKPKNAREMTVLWRDDVFARIVGNPSMLQAGGVLDEADEADDAEEDIQAEAESLSPVQESLAQFDEMSGKGGDG